MNRLEILNSAKPILFNTENVRAILDGRKTVTRRVVPERIRNKWYEWDEWQTNTGAGLSSEGVCVIFETERGFYEKHLPYKPGDYLYVRETYGTYSKTYGTMPNLYYKADGDAPENIKWKPSIHMPKEAARIFLRVTDVRVKQLQDITDEGAKAEGANYHNGKNVGVEEKMRRTAIERFAEIWDSTIKPKDRDKYGWAAKPWVWVTEFERVEVEE